jgi:hypothetical protein
MPRPGITGEVSWFSSGAPLCANSLHGRLAAARRRISHTEPAMELKDNTHCVAVFDRHEDAEKAIRDLQRGGFDMKKLSIVGRDYHTE